MRILALDHGTARIGAALSDPTGTIARPLEMLPAQPFSGFLLRLKELIREHEVELLLVGMPRNMDGSYGESAARVREFVGVLRDSVTVPIQTWDERLTTVIAERFLAEGGVRGTRRRARVDPAAAAVLLQGYLDGLAPQ